jgi:uncharacterized integral membrane protein
MQIFLLLALLIAIALVVFAVQNAAMVTVTFLAYHLEGSLALILVVVFVFGVLSGVLLFVPSFWRKNSALRELRRRVKQLEENRAVQSASLSQAKDK